MNSKARTGQWILIAIVVMVALLEIGLAALNFSTGRLRINHLGRALLTGWLLWKIWDGAAWARWLFASLFLIAALYAFYTAVSTDFEDRPEGAWIIGGFGVVSLLLTVGLASPWVGAYQAFRNPNRPDPTSWSELQKDRPWTR
jgi:hypothetical protein